MRPQAVAPTRLGTALCPPASAVATRLREVLASKLAAAEYGIDLLRVQEIRSDAGPTRIANAPHFIKGVVTLRRVIVPTIALRLRFNPGNASRHRGHRADDRPAGHGPGGRRPVGCDHAAPRQWRPVPQFGAAIARDHVPASAPRATAC